MISEFPLLLFTALTGLAGGAYVGAALFPKAEEKKPWLFPVIALVLVGVGCLGVLGHLGRPMAVLNVLNRPMSPLTMEGIFAGIFAITIIVDLVLGAKGQVNRGARIAGAVAGVLLMIVVTHLYPSVLGNPAWTAAPTLPLFVVGDIAAGLALWLALGESEEVNKTAALATAVFNGLLALVLAWQCAVFAGLGENIVPIALGAVLAVAAAVVAAIAPQGKMKANVAIILIAVLAIAAMVISRYGFYMASVL
jgi:anaerobic dimethyl sulfoxide reductase subunit C (anchor subunit)